MLYRRLIVRLPSMQTMSRRQLSTSPPPRSQKRARVDYLTKDDFKNGVFLAPMVRSGALPTRLFALKHGATLVWGPEIVDKAILHAKRNVHPDTGVVSYDGVSRAIFATHPIEKPYLIYQIGSSNPELAVQAAKVVQEDIAGVDLNCGCPKPFSTHSGMGAALLTEPDLLCSILVALREAMPAHITVSAKIRLLPSREDTLKLVERIVNTGISNLTVHCRTKSMREKDPATIERLREIRDFVDAMGKGIAVTENGDCVSYEDTKRVKDITGADSVMIARGAESNPSCFSPTPLTDLTETLIPDYIRLSRYLDNHWSLTKFCVAQFTGTRIKTTKTGEHATRQAIIASKGYDGVNEFIGEWSGAEVFKSIRDAIEARPARRASTGNAEMQTELEMEGDEAKEPYASSSPISQPEDGLVTPEDTQNPEPPSMTMKLPSVTTRTIPSMISGVDPLTPTPSVILP
ncbi:tRNA-dihydrouridine synthase 2 [Cylindrobasidium torrendii FP15055 ss-10]|uniref:tRNA-dihydrouridine synthase 2 n=1 Tax=Cylindrobasidium torrendii FP15055 ss-10 TaxID=1314674 RepID=A0A0D7B6V1_9AGAR|nr:tRNA-dihydrouridine synthase 2 [Cylindrobasidium torrendii FP15055 ss-10]